MKYLDYSRTEENTNLNVEYQWKNKITGNDTLFSYEIPYDVFMEEVRNYFDRKYDIKIDGKDNDIWNMLVDLGEEYNADIIQDILDDKNVNESLKKKLEKDAKEKFDELCQEEYEDDKDEDFYDHEVIDHIEK